jgi:hypothetical protein
VDVATALGVSEGMGRLVSEGAAVAVAVRVGEGVELGVGRTKLGLLQAGISTIPARMRNPNQNLCISSSLGKPIATDVIR